MVADKLNWSVASEPLVYEEKEARRVKGGKPAGLIHHLAGEGLMVIRECSWPYAALGN